MAMKTSISLTEEQDAYARSLVASGHYTSVSAVLQRGLEMLRLDAETHDAGIAALCGLIRRRMAEPSEPLESIAELLSAVERAD